MTADATESAPAETEPAQPVPPVEPGLLVRLAAPLQSWGEHSHFTDERDTAAFPTRSGVMGLLACALGLERGYANGELKRLQLTVRVDRAGHVLRDLHTVGGGLPREETVRTAAGGFREMGKTTVYGHRLYLSDAAFACAICVGPATHDSPDSPIDVLARWAHALTHPYWPPYLGRRSCPPEGPLLLKQSDNVLGDLLQLPLAGRAPKKPAITVFSDRPLPWLRGRGDEGTRPISEVQDEPERLMAPDNPRERRYRTRHLYRGTWHPPADRYTTTEGTDYLKALHHHLGLALPTETA